MNIVNKMLKNADLNYKKFNENVVRGNSPIIGIRIPELRKIAKDIIDRDSIDIFFKEYNGIYFEEKMIKGMIISSNEMLFDKYINNYLEELDSWCLVDTLCNDCKFIKLNLDKYWYFIKKLLNSNKEFVVRAAYVLILHYYLNDEYIKEVISLMQIHYDKYYVNMAIAWCISEMFIIYPERVETLLEKRVLSEFVQNKAIDKINDSYRVSVEDKVRLRELKYF